jgi:hypothetical protein
VFGRFVNKLFDFCGDGFIHNLFISYTALIHTNISRKELDFTIKFSLSTEKDALTTTTI